MILKPEPPSVFIKNYETEEEAKQFPFLHLNILEEAETKLEEKLKNLANNKLLKYISLLNQIEN